jgi:hypothetical protein
MNHLTQERTMRDPESARLPHRASWRLPSSLLLCLFLGGLGCNPQDPKQPTSPEEDRTPPTRVQLRGGVSPDEVVTGTRTLEASAEDDSGRLARMEFLVSNTLACTDTTAKDSGATFSCTWDSSATPPGTYQLIARAYDAAGNATSSEPISFTIPVPNANPTITSVIAEPDSVKEGTSTTLTVTASDPDADALTYSWSQTSPPAPLGTFGTEDGPSRTWTAPTLSSTTTYTLLVTVSDGKGGTAQSTVEVEVVNDPSSNLLPVVDEAITVSATTALAGDTLEFSIEASDPDGDPLTYTWTTNPAGVGTFSEPTAAATQWRAPEVSQAVTRTVLVTVSDGTDSVTRSVSIQVTVPSYANHIQPIWNQSCVHCHNSSVRSGGLNLQEGSSHASLVNANGTTTVTGCTTLKRVRANQPDNSLLVKKISGETCGTRMPADDSSHFDTHPGRLTRIRSWILAGAANN